ncbi:ThiF family adenylyltransferase [Runella slithyformis]|uniref:UBA/THIF-type NAD/FAD binding protein n=1 Tax=Runella slithyformis (strain ATCC 29530 / DSM 19594 / LMG 11500 / NCIMB 11436 / LSU 4) TaxID=761193 RepID=A0A7U4E958_RUNSL|nr:ThiF family adenylyltransferase [Runella slithyformis]AEI52164.1 UBA/THIF-type NAD/FAD binding protein [Runella slithyformis DSM 19594]
MSQQLISLSPDLKKLRDEGYEICIKGNYLLAGHIPYVNRNKEIMYGTLVSELTLVNNTRTAQPGNHVIHFIGNHPCNKDGTVISAIQHASNTQTLYQEITINHSFSNKPASGYVDYFHKISRYADIISAPAKSLDGNVTEKTFRVIPDVDETSVFRYLDTNTSRANIDRVNSKLKGQRVAIIGLGGTGAYLLDLIAKTPVKEIHLFDGDDFQQHNAFRSPGAAMMELDSPNIKKVDYYTDIYSRMHSHIIPHSFYINDSNLGFLKRCSFVFLSIDNNSARKVIIEYLVREGVPFIDTGLGVNLVDDSLIGTIRTTVCTPSKNDHIADRIPMVDNDNNDYSPNIQMAELNAMNAIFAVLKWKKLAGFYQDLEEEHHCTYSINVAQLQNEDLKVSVC